MVDKSRRKGLQIEVAHTIRTHNHRSLLLMESIYYLLQCIGRRIEVIAIELNGKLSAKLARDGQIPASTYSKVFACRLEQEETWTISYFLHDFTGTIGRMIIYDNDVELEIGLLAHCTKHCVCDGLLSIENWDDDGCLIFKVLLIKIRLTIVTGINQSAQFAKMLGTSLFHFYLHLPVTRIHIVELLLTALAIVSLSLGIEILIDMEDFSYSTQIKSQVVETCIKVFLPIALSYIITESLCLDEPEASKIEIITE